jgi:hypothetical protein
VCFHGVKEKVGSVSGAVCEKDMLMQAAAKWHAKSEINTVVVRVFTPSAYQSNVQTRWNAQFILWLSFG